MKMNVCDFCFYESSIKNPILTTTKYKLSLKNGQSRISFDSCEKHSKFLKDRKGKTIVEIEKEFDELKNKFYRV